jgi:hypothetical protein
VFLIRVICSCREMCAIKASSVARGVNISYVDAIVAVAGGGGGGDTAVGPSWLTS